jgi:hypothetical protein
MSGALNQTNLGSPVTTRSISGLDLAARAWGSEFRAPDHNIYRWSNGRGFDSTDSNAGGVYGVTDKNRLMIQDSRYPDMPSNSRMLQDSGYQLFTDQ